MALPRRTEVEQVAVPCDLERAEQADCKRPLSLCAAAMNTYPSRIYATAIRAGERSPPPDLQARLPSDWCATISATGSFRVTV